MEGMKSKMPRVKLGASTMEVSKLGFGCLGLTGLYDSPISDELGISIIKEAFENGITFFDTSDMYGPRTNEILLGKALKQLPRERIQVATKFGVVNVNESGMVVNGTPEYVRACCEMGELKKLVEEGKLKHIGLSEASPDTVRRAHDVHPVTALQMEWSLWTRDIEEEIVPLCRELGIGIVPYSPLGRGFFGGKGVVENLPESSFLVVHPRFAGANLEKNKVFYTRLESLATKHCCTPAQLALAWLHHQGDDVVAIPGTTKIKNLHDNINSVNVKLNKHDIDEISEAVPIEQVSGNTTYRHLQGSTWKFANTPSKSDGSTTS